MKQKELKIKRIASTDSIGSIKETPKKKVKKKIPLD